MCSRKLHPANTPPPAMWTAVQTMTANELRHLALGFPGASESAHMNHPDFRLGGKIFASLGYPGEGWGMVKLTPAQQESLIRQSPKAFVPCAGAWGRAGSTSVELALVSKSVVRAALEAAWKNVAATGRKRN